MGNRLFGESVCVCVCKNRENNDDDETDDGDNGDWTSYENGRMNQHNLSRYFAEKFISYFFSALVSVCACARCSRFMCTKRVFVFRFYWKKSMANGTNMGGPK